MKPIPCPLTLLWLTVFQALLAACRPLVPSTPYPLSTLPVLPTATATLPYSPDRATLASLQKIDDFPLYTMHYVGDYGFKKHIQERTSHGSKPSDVFALKPQLSFACTGFTAHTQQGERLMGRNFDWYHHPALLLFTAPPDGYASVSMVDISYLGFTGSILPDDPLALEELLQSPYLPFDGLNERGLAVGMMAVPHSEGGADPRKPTLDDLEVIRLLLDYAADVDQALELLNQYNVAWGGGPAIHYLVADASGNSAVVEYIGGQARIFRNTQAWQISTNFLFSDLPSNRPFEQAACTQCWRYKTANAALTQSDGVLSIEGAMGLLKSVSQPGATSTIWSVVYNLNRGLAQVAMGRHYEQVYTFKLLE